MATLEPVSLRLVDPAWVTETPAPAYDALSTEDRHRYIREHPLSYLTVTRGPDDAPPGQVWDLAEAQRQSQAALERIMDRGAFGPEHPPAFYLYRLTQFGHSQLALVAGVATDDYHSGMVRLHENLVASRARVLAEQMELLRVQSSPIAMTYEPIPAVTDRLTALATCTKPSLVFTSADGLHHEIWPIVDHEAATAIQHHFRGHKLHLIDGHHRAAAAVAAAETVPGAALMLCALFVTTELRNNAFHRFLHGIDANDLLERIESRFVVWRDVSLDDVDERAPSQLAVRTRYAWHLVDVPDLPAVLCDHTAHPGEADQGGELERAATAELARLESTRLQHYILGPLLGLAESSPGRTLSFRDGRGDWADLVAIEKVGAAADGPDMIWVTRPVSIEAFIAVSASSLKMPPKSTYFVPKARSGVFLRHL